MSANDSLQENAETVLVDDATATRVFDRAAGDTPSAVTAISAAFAASKLPNDATIVMLSEAEPVSLPITVLATPAQLGLATTQPSPRPLSAPVQAAKPGVVLLGVAVPRSVAIVISIILLIELIAVIAGLFHRAGVL